MSIIQCAFLSVTCILTLSFMSFLRANSITGGLVKGALSVAASAYKALFTGQTGSEKASLGGLSSTYFIVTQHSYYDSGNGARC